MKALKLLGIGSTKDKKLHKNLLLALEAIEHNSFNIRLVRNVNEIVNHGVRTTPALLLDNQVIVQGRICSSEELIDLLNTANKSTNP